MGLSDHNRPEKFLRVMEEFDVQVMMDGTSKMTRKIPGEFEEETPLPLPLLGRSVLFTRNGEGWQSRLVGGEPIEDQMLAIQEYDNPWPEDFVPNGEVKVGESWTMGGDRLRQLLGFAAEGFTGTMKSHFEQVVDHNGERCALLSLQIDVGGKVPTPEGSPMSATMSGEGFIDRSLAEEIDVYSKISGDLKLEGNLVEEGQTIQITITGPFVIEERITND